MSVSFELEAVSRSDTGKGASRRLRKTGMVPGIVYGAGKDPEMIGPERPASSPGKAFYYSSGPAACQ